MLINYLPPVLQGVKEYKIIMSGGDQENKELYIKVSDLENDQYFLDASENGIKQYEKMLGLTAKGTDTLEDRRFRVLSRYNQQVPYTKTVLEQKLITLCGKDGYKINIDYDNLILTIKIALTAKSMFNTVADYLEGIVPLNIIIDLSLLYNTWDMAKKLTWGQARKLTWKQLREEVI